MNIYIRYCMVLRPRQGANSGGNTRVGKIMRNTNLSCLAKSQVAPDALQPW